MDCVFIRHGIAVEPEEWEDIETRRPLTDKGKKRVRQAAEGLAAMRLAPTHLVSSPFTRARNTAGIIRRVLCPSLDVEHLDELSVGSTSEHVMAKLRKFPSDAVVVCVGHEPLLGEIIGVLLCGQPSHGFPMKKSGAAMVHLPDSVKPGQGQLQWWLEPAQLRVLGKSAKKRRKEKTESDD